MRSERSSAAAVACDGRVLAERRWSLVGTGTLTAEIESNGRSVRVEMHLPLSFCRSACNLSVDGLTVEARQIV